MNYIFLCSESDNIITDKFLFFKGIFKRCTYVRRYVDFFQCDQGVQTIELEF